MIENITVVSYLTENHKSWLPHWVKQLNRQTARGFQIVLVFHNWEPDITEFNNLIADLDDDHWDNLASYFHQGEPVIGDVIDRALKEIDTTYFAHWDLDDIFHPQRLELQAKFLGEHSDVDFLNARCLGFIGEPKPEMLDLNYVAPDEPYADVTEHDGIKSCLLGDNKNCLSHGLMVYKAEAMRKLGGFSRLSVMTDPLGRSPDHETWKKALMAGYKFHRLPQLLMLWNLKSSAIRDTSNAKE